ncbi:MAG TPA: hypothetical protein VF921_14920 [Vicinamibacterales bacterium]
MKRINFDPARLAGAQADWWTKWQKKADEATIAAIDAWERGDEVKFKDTVWGELKLWLLDNVFYGKCAYCETLAPRYPGHAEHFRPKGRVDVRDPATGKSVPAKVEWPDGKLATHPGYFWLAYNWKNLLPACQDCNSGRGKQNQFPLPPPKLPTLVAKLSSAEAAKMADRARASVKWKERYYLNPDALDAIETPQILNPYVEDPRRHLRFGDGGIVAPIDGSARGVESIRVYQLDDEKLRVDRQRQQDKAWLIYKTKYSMLVLGAGPAGFKTATKDAYSALADFESGKEEYSVAALDYVDIALTQATAAAAQGGGK